MNTEPNQQEYLLLFRGNWDSGLSPDKTQEVMDKCKAWYEGLLESGKLPEARL